MKSVGSCFPNCQRFLLPHQGILIPLSHYEMGSHLEIDPPSCSLPSSFSPPPRHSSLLLFDRTPGEMGVTAESQFHVLAVDDSLIDRKLIERLLKTSSYQVTAVDSGSKALEFLGLNEEQPRNANTTSVSPIYLKQEIEVSLIITDYFMPEMTGYDLLRKIKESKSYKDVPVVIMSSENVPSRISQCLEDGAEEFFLKPVQLSDVNKLRPHLLSWRSKEHHANSEKKKDREEILSPERTRTRYDVPEVF